MTFDGRPVKRVHYLFPQHREGNTGPGGGADIKDGAFTTASPAKVSSAGLTGSRSWDTTGVPYTENGEEVADGKALFPPTSSRWISPRNPLKKDFEVPLKPPPPKKKGPKEGPPTSEQSAGETPEVSPAFSFHFRARSARYAAVLLARNATERLAPTRASR